MEDTRNAPYSNGEDRISKLPDELIHYIMSFNDTKYAVQTSVLSKRWIHVWKYLPTLRFDRSSFSKDKKDKFVMFVDMVLLFRKDIDIHKFRMAWENSAYDNSVVMNITRWSLAAVKYNVKDFRMVISEIHDSAYEFTHHFLNCKSLKKLEMLLLGNDKYANIILPGSMNLPRLQTLHLSGLSISNAELSKTLFSSCPVLKSLRILDCNIQTDNQRYLIVDSVSLKRFEYSYCCTSLLPQNDTAANIIKLCAPNLKNLICRSFLTQDYSIENCSPLSRVKFYMKLKEKEERENYSRLPVEEKDQYGKRMLTFLAAVYMVKDLSLSPGFLEVVSQALDRSDCQPPRLCNLRCLTLDMWFTRGCMRTIAYLLKLSPNIETILLTSKESNLPDVGDDWDAGVLCGGILSHLKYVQVKQVEGCDAELKLLRFFLKNAEVLEKVAIFFQSSVGSQDRMRQIKRFKEKLRAVPTASSSIQMVFN